MREWLEATVARIGDLAPKRVLEIGCGVGLLVEALAPRCEAYCGTDFSATAINRLREFTSARPALQHVQLIQREAIDFDGLPPGSFDTVVINSVIQYFPHLDYLKLVLERAAEMVTPGGHIFVGDVRHLGLLRSFHCSVQLAKASPELTVRALKRKIALAMEQEKELVISPLFFLKLACGLPQITGVQILVKRGGANNELTRYRYDVVLRVGKAQDVAGETAPFAVRVEDPNPAADDVAALHLLDFTRDDETVEDLRNRAAGLDPAGIRRADLGESPAARPLATDPIAAVLRNGLALTLGQFLRSRLPHAPLPASVVVLSENAAPALGTSSA
jgi:ubiquinone/menaquinone biosynthesis C-methylase UbiE